ncbi:glia maturation factor beta [Xylariaceae sp. FL0594]|nr:glia maturation factor beta [Xylariaceae sp. FL0594]
MSADASYYTFSPETREHLRKFRLTTSRVKEPQAVIYLIDKETLEIRQDDDKVVYTSLEDLAEDIPENSPRFILLSYPLTKPDGRLSVPYVQINYLPTVCNTENRMRFAGAKELMRTTSEAGRVIDIESSEELEGIPDKLR